MTVLIRMLCTFSRSSLHIKVIGLCVLFCINKLFLAWMIISFKSNFHLLGSSLEIFSYQRYLNRCNAHILNFAWLYGCINTIYQYGGLNRCVLHRQTWFTAWHIGYGPIMRCGLVGGGVYLQGLGSEVSYAHAIPNMIQSFLLLPETQDVELSAPSPACIYLFDTMLSVMMTMD